MTIAELVQVFLEPLLRLIPAVIGADGDEAMNTRGGTARSAPDFDASLTDQIPGRRSDNRVITNQQCGSGGNLADVGFGDHVLDRLVNDRRGKFARDRVLNATELHL